jgi:hypothetical protein
VLGSVEKYDPLTRQWFEAEQLIVPRFGAGVCIFQDKIWVAGGMYNSSKWSLLKHVECYDTLRKQ